MKLVLASASPRRRDLLDRFGIHFDVRPVDIEEEIGASSDPQIVARRIARAKAEAARLLESTAPILAADTVVALDGAILGKPRHATRAREMLQSLRGRMHQVVTAVALLPAGETAALIRHPITYVTMRNYSDEEIDASIDRGDPFDKAGGYAIQDEILRPVESYDGCYCNVVGLPLWPAAELLRKTGLLGSQAGVHELLPSCERCPLRRV